MIFVDTSAWLALVDTTDVHHRSAMSVEQEIRTGSHGRLVTTDYVLDETLTIVRDRAGVPAAKALAERVIASPSTHLLWVDERQFHAAMELLFSHEDKRWSLTDCTSFVVMRAMDLTRAFSFDKDFRQAGFETLPAS